MAIVELVDAPAALGTFLAANSELNTLVGGRFYADTDFPPPEYDPSQGGALCWKARQTANPFSTTETSGLFVVNFQMACFGKDRAAAAAVYRQLFKALDGQGGAVMRQGNMDAPGSPLLSPGGKWHMVIVFYTCKFANS